MQRLLDSIRHFSLLDLPLGLNRTARNLSLSKKRIRIKARLLLENRSFGYPGTDGRLFSNYMAYLMNRHPLLSIFFCHPHHPFTKGERIVVLWCSIFWVSLSGLESVLFDLSHCNFLLRPR